MTEESLRNRRPLASRNTGWAQRITALLSRTPITPNQVSVLSVVAAAIAGVLFYVSGGQSGMPKALCLLFAGIAVQLRLLCNLFDGLLAVEMGMQSPDGGVYNELPDRIADIVILAGVGYCVGQPELGWAAGALAVFTAYVRELGHGLGAGVDFSGPQAKPHRMAVITIGCVFAIVEIFVLEQSWILLIALWVVALGTGITVARRTAHLLRVLNN